MIDNPWFNWVRKNWFTVVGIIIILGVVWYDVETHYAVVKEKVDECIMHYEQEIKTKCPVPIQSFNLDYNYTLEDVTFS